MSKKISVNLLWRIAVWLLIFAIGFASGQLFQPQNADEQSSTDQEVVNNGVSIKLTGSHPEGLNYRLDLCYTLPDANDWLMTSPFSPETTYILFNGYQVSPFEEGTTTWKYSSSGEVSERCEYLIFYRPDLSFRELTLVVTRLYAYETEYSDCESLQGRMITIYNFAPLECMEVDGIKGWTFVQFPLQSLDDRILKEQVRELIIKRHEGPWQFNFLNQ